LHLPPIASLLNSFDATSLSGWLARNRCAENEDHRMTDRIHFPRIFALLKAAGHDAVKAAEIVIDAQRKDLHARIWIRTIAASRRSVLPASFQMRRVLH
jgi:hypothetical protein